MYNKRSTLFLTEALLLVLISQLFWPLQQYIDAPGAVALVKILLSGAAGISLLVLPGWWWSYLFFSDDQIGNFERFIISLAISLSLVVFSSAYLKSGGIAVYPWTVLVVISLRLLFGILVSFVLSYKKSSLEEEIE